MKRLMGVTYICTRYNETPTPAAPDTTIAFCHASGTVLLDVRLIAVSAKSAAPKKSR